MSPTILHVDMNAFFASVEQAANPSLRGRPIAIIGAKDRTVVMTASYEAKRFGVKTGCTVFEARKRCPMVEFVIGDPDKYTDTSRTIMRLFERYTPQVEVCSIDEAFLDVTGSLHLFGPAETIARMIKRDIADACHITCSVGIAPNKLLAKLASEMQKPDGLVVIRAEDVPGCLEDVAVGELCGVGPRTTAWLHGRGIRTCGQLQRVPREFLVKQFGVTGAWLHDAAHGRDNEPVLSPGDEPAAKSVGHSMTLDADVRARAEVEMRLQHMAEMVGRRLRAARRAGRTVTVTIRFASFKTVAKRHTFSQPVCLGHEIFAHARRVWDTMPMPEPVRLVGVSVSNLSEGVGQPDLFGGDARAVRRAVAMDAVNDRYGEFTVYPAALLERSRRAPVIAPSWRPGSRAVMR